MFTRIRELRDKRNQLVTQAGAILEAAGNENRDLTAEEETRFNALHTEADALKVQYERLERQATVEHEIRESLGRQTTAVAPTDDPETTRKPPAPTDTAERLENEKKAFRSWLRFGNAGLTPEERTTLAPYQVRREDLSEAERRALTTQTDNTGGYTIPEGFRAVLETALKEFGGMRRTRATILPTDSGNDLPMPTANDTASIGAILAENTAVAEQDPAFGQLMLKAYKYSSKLVRIPIELTEDSAFDLIAWLAGQLTNRIGRILNQHFTTGTGTAQPKGAVTAAAAGKVGAIGQTVSVIWEDLVDLIHSIDPDYRADGEFMLGDTTLAHLRKYKDAENRPLWQPGLAAGEPDRILSYPYIVNRDMADMAANAKSILFGDFSKYLIRDVRGMRLVRLVERYAEFDQIGVMAFSRHDGNLLDAGTAPLKYYQNSAT